MVTRIRASGFVARLAVGFGLGLVAAGPSYARQQPKIPPSKPAVAQRSPGATRAPQSTPRVQASQGRTSPTSIPRLKTDGNGALVPDVRAAAAIIYDPVTDQVLWEEHADVQRPIASITKVMTVLLVFEQGPYLEQRVLIERADTRQASTTRLRTGDKVTVGGLLHLALIASDNAAARALARVSEWGAQGFVVRMNERARELRLDQTCFADPSGLLAENVSSAYDMARLIAHAAADERISAIMRKPEARIWTGRRYVTIRSTNKLLQRADLGNVDVKGGKTGFIAKSGYCFATLLGIPPLNQQVAVVVLGARSNSARFLETRNILKWLAARAPAPYERDPSP